ncbi:MAG: RlmE family RNA methyltransferase [Deltaproteobacteria bacterium]|nr:RlmE family RNA methyltransferase [Deltaproteobacteria bacterium]
MSGNYDRKDKLYQRAKEEGYRSRAAFKLIELDKKYKLLRSGIKVVDLGCWPGGWLQVVAGRLGTQGVAVGIDLVETIPFSEPNVHVVTGDAREDVNIEKVRSYAPEGFDLLLSDMSPKLSGIKEADQAGTVACAELALWGAQTLLKKGGSFVCKVFKGNETELFYRAARPAFEKLQRSELDATRKTSNEFYLIGTGYKGQS